MNWKRQFWFNAISCYVLLGLIFIFGIFSFFQGYYAYGIIFSIPWMLGTLVMSLIKLRILVPNEKWARLFESDGT